MIDFSSFIDLPLVWGFLIATAVFLYAILDGFDLGCGILFPFAPSKECKDLIMNSIAPFWDGNETWLVLGGGGIFAAFPLAYSILMPALYLPVISMLLGLILRGVAFEFRFKSDVTKQKIWDIAFHSGSLLAAFMQGIILGNFIQGIDISGRSFAGDSLGWVNGFAIVMGIGLVFGYALLGATWLIMKTTGDFQKWARRVANYVIAYVILNMMIVSISMPIIENRIKDLWFSIPNFFYLLSIPLITFFTFILLWKDLQSNYREVRPFLLTIALFLLGYIGIGISMYPWIVPFKYTIWQAAAVSTSQSLLLIGAVIFLPIILVYTAYVYYLFRGKTQNEKTY